MRVIFRTQLMAAAIFSVTLWCGTLGAATPVKLIFDTDMGNDVDDALALAMIHALETRGEVKLLAVTVSKDNRYAAPFIDLVNTFYGRAEIPIGVVKQGKTPEDSAMIRVPAERRNSAGAYVYPHRLTDGREAPDAVAVLRRVLAAAENGSVVIAMVGFSTNMARLLNSGPDSASPLSGARLVAEKVRLLSTMAGRFSAQGQAEYNVKIDIPSARKVFEEWPSPVVFSGFEIGQAMLFPAASIVNDFAWVADHPVADAYRQYKAMPYDRPTWDLTAVLYAVRPERQYFGLSTKGRVTVDDSGQTIFQSTRDGTRRYLTLSDDRKARTLEAMILLASEPRLGK